MAFQGCGIAGAVASDATVLARVDINEMVKSLHRRGPNSNGTWASEGVLFGHTRLSILDLSSKGHQPMSRKNLTITYNGEVYNHEDLKKKLEAEGYNFESTTDTEVVLYSFMAWGVDCVNLFHGFFSFAIWNEDDRTLFVASDRFGIKPFYYYNHDGAFIFGSSVESLMRSKYIPLELNKEAIYAHTLGQVLCNLDITPIANIYSLTPGHYLWVKKGEVTKHRYWDFPKHIEEPLSPQEIQKKFEELLRRGVESRFLVSDVPVCMFLSGGCDSTSAAACLVPHIKKDEKLKCITIIHGEEAKDLYYTRKVASHFPQIDLQEIPGLPSKITIDHIMKIVDLSTFVQDMRLFSVYQNYQTVAANGYKVVLNCQGADECMAGYITRPGWKIAFYDVYKPEISPLSNLEAGLSLDYVAQEVKDYFPKYKQLLDEKLASYTGGDLERICKLMFQTSLRHILRFEDFLSMYHSIECRVPFLDHSLVEFCFALPFAETHINLETSLGKLLLRKFLNEAVGEEISERPKSQFPSPNLTQTQADFHEIFSAHKDEILQCESVKIGWNTALLSEKWEECSPNEIFELVCCWLWYVKLEECVGTTK